MNPNSIALDGDVPKPKRVLRSHSAAFKQQVIAEMIAGDESTSVIARRHNINANLAFKWKREFEPAGFETTTASGLVPVHVQPSVSEEHDVRVAERAEIEIALSAGNTVFVRGDVHPPTLKFVLEALA